MNVTHGNNVYCARCNSWATVIYSGRDREIAACPKHAAAARAWAGRLGGLVKTTEVPPELPAPDHVQEELF